MTGLFRWTHAIRRLLFVDLVLRASLIAVTGLSPKPFTKRTTLPSLEKIPDASGPEPSRDYSVRLPIVYTNELAAAEEWVSEHLKPERSSLEHPVVLGWDMESSPYLPWLEHKYRDGFSYFGPATLQLSTSESSLVVQIAEDGFGPIHEGGLPTFLHDLLENPSVIPTGVGIDDDLVELYRWCLEHGDDCAGPAWANPAPDVATRFDMGGIGGGKGGRTTGLAKLVSSVLGVVLPKSKQLARTHWSKTSPLSKNEVAYAARDAWAGAAVLERLGELDGARFGPSIILETLEAQTGVYNERPLRGIKQISNRNFLRKAAKTEWKDIRNPLDEDGKEKPEWTDEQRDRHDELEIEIKKLAPSPPIQYEITDSLGLKVQ